MFNLWEHSLHMKYMLNIQIFEMYWKVFKIIYLFSSILQ